MDKPPKVVGITGISGSGKTHFLNALKLDLGMRICSLSFDNYYKPFETQMEDENGFKNFDLPSALQHELFCEHLSNLILGNSIVHKKYRFENFNEPEENLVVSPAEIIVAEGLFVFAFPEIIRLINHKIYIDTDKKISLDRRLKRDEKERGIPAERSMYQWENHVIPSFQMYIEPWKAQSQLVLDGNIDPMLNIQWFKRELGI